MGLAFTTITFSDESEILLTIKTQDSFFDSMKNFIKEYHLYSAPGIIDYPIVDGDSDNMSRIQ